MNEGWIKLHRVLLDNPIWTCSTPEQKVILITILSMVNHTPNKWLWKGKKYEVKPGQMITSLDSIVKECGKNVSIRNVRTALVKFKKLEFLTDEVTSQGRFISIINWDTYQMTRQATDKVSDKQVTDDRQTPDKQVTPNKERKNVKKEKNKRINTLFDQFWASYPKKKSRQDALKAFAKINPDDQLFTDILIALGKQKNQNDWLKDNGQFIPHPTTWLNGGKWEDDISLSPPKEETMAETLARRQEERDFNSNQGENQCLIS